MNETDTISYSSEAQLTNYHFYKDLNDVNIFVEDTDKEYEYETIFKRLFGDKYKITKIIAVGGKSNLTISFREFGIYNEENPNIKNVYLADGDFDRIIHQDKMIDNNHYIYLESYNIESYFIDKIAVEKYVKGKLRCLDTLVEEKISFDTWKTTIVLQARKLFLVYCYIMKYHPTEKSVSRNTYLFIDSNTGLEKPGSYESYFESIKILDKKAPDRIAEIEDIYNGIYNDNGYNLICGKFLFDSLYCHITQVINKKSNKEDLRWHLINNFNIDSLEYLKDKMISVM